MRKTLTAIAAIVSTILPPIYSLADEPEPTVNKGKFSVPVSPTEVGQNWNKRGYSCKPHVAGKGWISRNHKHHSDEIVTVVKGHLALVVGEQRLEVTQGDELLIPANTMHRLENLHDGDLIMPYGLKVHVGTPSNKCT